MPRYSSDLLKVAHVATPATELFLEFVAAGAAREAVQVLDEHWMELWYALDPTQFREIVEGLPAEVFAGARNAGYLNSLLGVQLTLAPERPAAPEDARTRLNRVGQQMAELRISGKPAEALALALTMGDEIAELKGRLVDTSGGRFATMVVQAGITALLAGDLRLAKACFNMAIGSHRPVRFPFIEREALAKLALTHAIAGDPLEAASCLDRADQLPRTVSWVEKMVDDSLLLARYICAVDALDFETAEEMRRADPSPFSHLEFWGVALLAQVRHLCLTGRGPQARELCDEVAGLGLPLPGSDGWLSRMLDDAYLQCSSPSEVEEGKHQGSPGELALNRRLHLLATGQYQRLTIRDEVEGSPEIRSRTQLSLDLIRGQGLLHAGRADDGRTVILSALESVFERGTLGVLRCLTTETLDLIGDTDLGRKSARLVADHEIALVKVVTVLRSPLSPAEMRALRMLARGYSRAQIAEASYVSVDTVKSQLSSAYKKLNVTKRDDAVAMLERLEG